MAREFTDERRAFLSTLPAERGSKRAAPWSVGKQPSEPRDGESVPNGLRTRVYRPPRAFVGISGSSAQLSQCQTSPGLEFGRWLHHDRLDEFLWIVREFPVR